MKCGVLYAGLNHIKKEQMSAIKLAERTPAEVRSFTGQLAA